MSGLGLPTFEDHGIEFLLKQTAIEHGLTVSELRSKSRKPHLVFARYDFCKRASKSYTQKEIAEAISIERSVVSYAINKYQPPRELI
jgi:chromosomal replication initiation ATPase DnaA